MTRINIIPPSELYDQHLVAEYREIVMVASSLSRSLASKVGFNPRKIPKQFTLNKGHVYFFYDKGLYLEKRYRELTDEMRLRGMNPDPDRVFPAHLYPRFLYNDWVPSEIEQNIIRERINLRLGQKPGWYRKTERITQNESC
jgi:deoxyribonuclease (pyrimidine dimer)